MWCHRLHSPCLLRLLLLLARPRGRAEPAAAARPSKRTRQRRWRCLLPPECASRSPCGRGKAATGPGLDGQVEPESVGVRGAAVRAARGRPVVGRKLSISCPNCGHRPQIALELAATRAGVGAEDDLEISDVPQCPFTSVQGLAALIEAGGRARLVRGRIWHLAAEPAQAAHTAGVTPRRPTDQPGRNSSLRKLPPWRTFRILPAPERESCQRSHEGGLRARTRR
mmetsp:Transcript_47106/g.134899  ORF Transcript_47106/g.134899 Transcript_47106/m.134899 type:complete len:225 (+) Transcript_47106:1483-2157(+)